MKIVDTDNFDGDYPNEKVIAENIKNLCLAKIMCNALNKQEGEQGLRYYKIVDDDYVLVPGFQP